jgi:hypothetical protein
MAEIKSAIELAMERTKNLVMDKDEKETFARQELENRIRAILRRYLEGMIDGRDVKKEVTETTGDGPLKESLLLDLLIEEIDVAGENSKLIRLFTLIGEGLPEPLRRELNALEQKFSDQLEKQEVLVRARILDKLKGMAISGDSLDPNIEAWDSWHEAVGETRKVFKKSITEWKEKVARSINGEK